MPISLSKFVALVVLIFAIYLGIDSFWRISEIDFDVNDIKMSANYTAVVLGGSGGVGRGIVRALAKAPQFSKVSLILRKPMDLQSVDAASNFEKFDQKVMDFEKISEQSDLFNGYDVAFYAIGVSSALVTPEVYKKVELDNALELANAIKNGGVKDVHWVTGQGTSKNSLFLFGKTKAQVEETVSGLGFRRASFYRPAGVLTSDDSGQLGPTTKKVMGAIDVCRWMSIDADLLGRVMVSNALKETDKSVEILENGPMNKIGKALPK